MYLLTPAHHSDAVCVWWLVSMSAGSRPKLTNWAELDIIFFYWTLERCEGSEGQCCNYNEIYISRVSPPLSAYTARGKPGLSQRSLVTCDSIISILCPSHRSTVTLMPMPINWFFVLPKFSSFTRTRTPRVHKCVKTEIDCIILIPDMSPRTK